MRLGRATWMLACVLALTGTMTLGPLATDGAQAATVLALDLKGLVKHADVIAVGQARQRSARWAKYGKLIVTDVEFAVQRPLKGAASAGEALVITTLGGTVEELALSVPGAAQLAVGQRALVFLRRQGDDLRVVGMAQGVMPVHGHGQGATVVPAAGQLERVVAANKGDKTPEPAPPMASRPLDELLTEIAALVASQG